MDKAWEHLVEKKSCSYHVSRAIWVVRCYSTYRLLNPSGTTKSGCNSIDLWLLRPPSPQRYTASSLTCSPWCPQLHTRGKLTTGKLTRLACSVLPHREFFEAGESVGSEVGAFEWLKPLVVRWLSGKAGYHRRPSSRSFGFSRRRRLIPLSFSERHAHKEDLGMFSARSFPANRSCEPYLNWEDRIQSS